MPPAPQLTEAADADLAALVDGGNAFALDLYRRLAAGGGNVVVSPYSLAAALAMTAAGARGDTAAQMAKVLGTTPLGDRVHAAQADLARRLKPYSRVGGVGGAEFRAVNVLLGQTGLAFDPEFLRLTRDYYGAGFRGVDFAADPARARRTVNAWAAKQTRGKIADLVPDGVIDRLTRLVLANAVYFRGAWAEPFKPADTADAPFHLSPGETTPVRMMAQQLTARRFAGGGVKVVGLPYLGHDFAMLLVVPDAVDGLPAVERALSAGQLRAWVTGLEAGEVRLALPAFNLTANHLLAGHLQALGLRDAFGDAGDFGGITAETPLAVAEVVQQAMIEVDEGGTTAAAATAMRAFTGLTRRPTEEVTVRADRPFLFLIVHHDTQAVLFAGRVARP